MAQPWIIAVFTVFAWWFFTGAILLVVRRSDAGDVVAHGRSVVLAVPLLALGVAGLVVSSGAMTLTNIYMAFLSTLLIWGWIELAFLAGIITGPERRPCPAHLDGTARFIRAFNTVAFHEVLLLAALVVIAFITVGTENTVALWTYLILFGARISAKLNLFFGVPRINTEFVPQPLQHIKSYFRQGRITVAFPIGITALSIAVAVFAVLTFLATTPVATAGFTMLTTLSALALIEHWVMVLPLPDAKLWRWMLPAPQTNEGNSHEL